MLDVDRAQLRYGPPQTSRLARVPPAAWPAVVCLTSLVVALVAGLSVFAVGTAGGSGDGWAALGAFLLALAVGGGVFGLGYILGIAVVAQRAFPPGRRALPVLGALALPVVILGFAAAVAALCPVPIWSPVYFVVAVATLASGPAAFAWAGTPAGRLRLAAGLAGLLVTVTAGAFGSTAVAAAEADRAAAKLPLVLFHGASAEAPFAGWRRDVSSVNRLIPGAGPFAGGHQVYLKYFTPRGVVFVTMHAHAGPCEDTKEYACEVVSDLDGNELRRYERTSGYGYYPTASRIDAVVYPDGRAVSVQGPDTSRRLGTADRPSARDVLGVLDRVDSDAFERATGAPLRTR